MYHRGLYVSGCQVSGFFGSVAALAQIWSIAAVSYDRFRGIHNPLSTHKRTTNAQVQYCLYLTSCKIVFQHSLWKSLTFFILFYSISLRSCWYSSGWHQSFFQHFHCLDGANTYQRYVYYKHRFMHISLYETFNAKMHLSLFT